MIKNYKLNLCFLLDRVTNPSIVKGLLFFFKSSALYIERQKKVVKEKSLDKRVLEKLDHRR